ncbi:MAG: N-acetylneuraminate synthase family protein [Phycisphaeraceae bacterium]|nr:N-acetylneuraminate synthase family protein [Phycisphaeraceae bacterium]
MGENNGLIHFVSADSDRGPSICVIAEIGVNHDGDVAKALALTQAAKQAGVDAVKLQFFDPDVLLSKQALLADYQKTLGQTDVHAMLRALALDLKAVTQVCDLAHELAMGFVITPFSLEHIPVLMGLDLDAVKIASPDVVNLPLLESACELGKPMLVSTGTTDLAEIAPAAQLLKKIPAACLLHCVSSYPTPPQEAGLSAIRVIADAYDLPTGYSDHTTSSVTGALAVAAGACVIEKHLTYDCHAFGPDHAASMEPDALGEYVLQIRQAAVMLGKRIKVASDVECDIRHVSRQSVCAVRDLSAGQTLTRQDLTLRRPELESLQCNSLRSSVRH